jgi:hypothetical protein
LREVIAHCIHGVDRNPMALELARTALWLEGFEPGRALSFLDHHLVCGDALLGVMEFKQVEMGIPQEAYKALSGDDADLCKELAKANKVARKALADLKDGGTLFLPADRQSALAHWTALEAMPDGTPEEAETKAQAYRDGVERARHGALAQAADLFVGAFIAPKLVTQNEPLLPTTATLQAILFGMNEVGSAGQHEVVEQMQRLCSQARVLHWPLAFPQVFAAGGFDCVLGNPPWERIKLQEEEFFATRHPDIADAKHKAERTKRINLLKEGMLYPTLHSQANLPAIHASAELLLHQDFLTAKRISEGLSQFAHLDGEVGGRFKYTGVGDVNTFALFSETISGIRSPKGRAGFIVPSGIATDDSTKALFVHLIAESMISSIISFTEIRKWFPATDDRKPFCLFTIAHSEFAEFIFDIGDLSEITNKEKWFSLSYTDFDLINPNTKTCPLFRSNFDAQLSKKIYRSNTVLFREATEDQPADNPWGFDPGTMFHMSNDSGLFRDTILNNTGRYLPLYEAKMIHQFDHRWATYTSNGENPEIVDTSIDQKKNIEFKITPKNWIEESQTLAKIANVPKSLSNAYLKGDFNKALYSLASWIEVTIGEILFQDPRQVIINAGGKLFENLPDDPTTWRDPRIKSEIPKIGHISESELDALRRHSEIGSFLDQIMDSRSPTWILGWRSNAKTDDVRTAIATVMPRAAIGNSIFCFELSTIPKLSACFLACINSLPFDYIARQKVGGNNFSFYYFKQLPVFHPERLNIDEINFLASRVLELTFTSIDLKPWALDLGYSGMPFQFDPGRRILLRSEIDAFVARRFGLTREELSFILDPAEAKGPEYPSETFRVLKNNEMHEYGEYRSKRLVLEAWDALP